MTRLHPQDPRAIVAASLWWNPAANKGAIECADALLAELERWAPPEPQAAPSGEPDWHLTATAQKESIEAQAQCIAELEAEIQKAEAKLAEVTSDQAQNAEDAQALMELGAAIKDALGRPQVTHIHAALRQAVPSGEGRPKTPDFDPNPSNTNAEWGGPTAPSGDAKTRLCGNCLQPIPPTLGEGVIEAQAQRIAELVSLLNASAIYVQTALRRQADAEAKLDAIEAAKVGEPEMPKRNEDECRKHWGLEKRCGDLVKWGSLGWNTAAVLKMELAQAWTQKAVELRIDEAIAVTKAQERERCLEIIRQRTEHVWMDLDLTMDSLRAALEPKP